MLSLTANHNQITNFSLLLHLKAYHFAKASQLLSALSCPYKAYMLGWYAAVVSQPDFLH